MIILIDGPDGSGKTTLAKELSAKTGYRYIHFSMPKTDEEKDSMYQAYEKLLKTYTNIILDRCWYSEMVYGPIFRDKSEISYVGMYALEAVAAKHGAIIVYCTDEPDTLWKRCTKRGEDFVKFRADFDEVCGSFDDLMKGCPHSLPVFTYGYKEV